MEPTDKQLLKQLTTGMTTTTLFCPHCYRPFLESDGKVKSKLLLRTQYRSMIDYISAILFVVTLIAWMLSVYVFRSVPWCSVRAHYLTIYVLIDRSDRYSSGFRCWCFLNNHRNSCYRIRTRPELAIDMLILIVKFGSISFMVEIMIEHCHCLLVHSVCSQQRMERNRRNRF